MNLPQAAMNWGAANESFLETRFPLHRACRDGEVEKLGSLLESGEHDLYEEDDFYGWTPVHWCSYFGKLSCLMKLLDCGANCDVSTDRLNQTPAHIAAYGGDVHCLKCLLHYGALISRQDYMGETPAHKAARTGSMECLSLLVSQGADLSIRNHSGNTPSQVAAAAGYTECGHYLERAAQIQAQASEVYDEMRVPVTHPHCNGINPIINPHTPDKSTPIDAGGGQVHAQHFISTNTYHSNPYINCDGSQNNNNNNSSSMEADGCDMEMGEEERGHGPIPWMANPCEVPNGDVLLSKGVSQNIVPLAGRKRGREDVEEEGFKRARNDDYTFLYSARQAFSELPFSTGPDIADNQDMSDSDHMTQGQMTPDHLTQDHMNAGHMTQGHMTNGHNRVNATEVKVDPMLTAIHRKTYHEPVSSCLRFKEPQVRCLNFMSHYI